MSKLKLLALFAVLAGVATVVYKRLTAGDDVWQSVTDPIDTMVEEATPAVQADFQAASTTESDLDIERGIGEGLPPEDPFEGRLRDPLTDPLPEEE